MLQYCGLRPRVPAGDQCHLAYFTEAEPSMVGSYLSGSRQMILLFHLHIPQRKRAAGRASYRHELSHHILNQVSSSLLLAYYN